MARLQMIEDGHLGGYIKGGDPGTWCAHLWSWMVREFGIQSVLDVGCGEGHSTRCFHELGCQVRGVDGCVQAIADSVIPDCVVRHDFCQGAYQAPEPVDMIWSCEFLEHVEERFLSNVLRTFAQAARFILVTHAFPGQDDGHHHVNCRPTAYWIDRIEALGFECRPDLTRRAQSVTLADYHGFNHFSRSGLVFVRTRPSASAEQSLPGLWRHWANRWKAWKINQGFRWSGAYFRQRLRYRAHKRRLRKTLRESASTSESDRHND